MNQIVTKTKHDAFGQNLASVDFLLVNAHEPVLFTACIDVGPTPIRVGPNDSALELLDARVDYIGDATLVHGQQHGVLDKVLLDITKSAHTCGWL